jgi:hypothetical protein
MKELWRKHYINVECEPKIIGFGALVHGLRKKDKRRNAGSAHPRAQKRDEHFCRATGFNHWRANILKREQVPATMAEECFAEA